MIPVSKGSPYYPAEEAPSGVTPTTVTSIIDEDDDDDHWPHSKLFPSTTTEHRISSVDLPSTSSSTSSATDAHQNHHHPPPIPGPSGNRVGGVVECLSPEEEQKKDLDELLGKIDSTIASSRRFVAKSQDSSEYAAWDDDNHQHNSVDYDGAYQNAGPPSSSSSMGHMRNMSGGSGNFHTASDDTMNLITNTRQVKNSLQRLERTQDELFEL